MNLIASLKQSIIAHAKQHFTLTEENFKNFEFKINAGSEKQFGDVSTNVAMILAKHVGLNPRVVATDIKELLQTDAALASYIQAVELAGPGFINISLTPHAWERVVNELYGRKQNFFKHASDTHRKYLIEFVSANPTGPLHLGHGRGGVVGDVLARVLTFLGNTVHKEFYINDAGNQIKLLGQSLKARCFQELGIAMEVPEEGYGGFYLVDLAKDCVAAHPEGIKEKSDQFFELYAKEQLLNLIRADLARYRITFDEWFSEKNLHDNGSVQEALNLLIAKNLAYEKDGALWFKSTDFGDDKDRVVRKSTGELTYIAADIAYHKNKFDRGYDVLVDTLGHDHHGYVKRLKATMAALGYNDENLHVILYQLVTIKENDVVKKMSKRAGVFTKLSDVIDEVGTDVARFFYLNRKTDMPLDFDMAAALAKTDENPAYYIQYAFVRINSLLEKACVEGFNDWISKVRAGGATEADVAVLMPLLSDDDIQVLKKIAALQDILSMIATSYQTHVLSYYALELAQLLHGYYTKNKIIDTKNEALSRMRMLVVFVVHQTLGLCLDLLGLSKPEKM
jgi:arginyl-tRNA synthetase